MSVIQHHDGEPGMRDGLTYLRESLSFGRFQAEALDQSMSGIVRDGGGRDQMVELAMDAGLEPDEVDQLVEHYSRDLTGWTATVDGKHCHKASRSQSTPRRNTGKVHVKIRRGPDGKPVGKPPTPSQGRLMLAGGIAAAKAHAAAQRSRKETAARLKREMRKGRRKVVRDVMRWLR